METQTYSRRYVNYDSLKGQTDWTFLSPNEQMRVIDTNVARQALSSGEAADEVKQIVFYGSCHCQKLNSLSERIVYVSEILREAYYN